MIHESKPKKLRFADEIIKEESKMIHFNKILPNLASSKTKTPTFLLTMFQMTLLSILPDIKIFETDDGYQQFYFMDYLEENNKL